MEIMRVMESGNQLFMGLAFLLAGALVSALWARLGGLVGSPHYANSWGNYFFHFPILFIAFTLGYVFWKDAFLGSSGSHSDPSSHSADGRGGGFGQIFWNHAQAFAVGLGTGSLAKTFSSYGAHHEMYFAFAFFQMLLIGWISAYLWNGERFFGITIPGKQPEYETNDSYDSDNFEYDESENFEEFLDPTQDYPATQTEESAVPDWEDLDKDFSAEEEQPDDSFDFDPSELKA